MEQQLETVSGRLAEAILALRGDDSEEAEAYVEEAQGLVRDIISGLPDLDRVAELAQSISLASAQLKLELGDEAEAEVFEDDDEIEVFEEADGEDLDDEDLDDEDLDGEDEDLDDEDDSKVMVTVAVAR